MALFNKLFSNTTSPLKHHNHASDKLFIFSKDQVRIVLFRECDFRGRKLLFDSNSVKKVPLDTSIPNAHEKLSEISDGFGYLYTKPEADFNQLAEMVFGSVAMSFRETFFKMHNLDSPNRIMFTQVFSSPRTTNQGRRVSASSRCSSVQQEHSRLDDSGASISEKSTASDTVLVCRRRQSKPLDVPLLNGVSISIPAFGDSGYCGHTEHSFVKSGPSSFSTDNGSFSSTGIYKRWMRRTSTSLGNSGLSLTSSGSAQDSRPYQRTAKLGLSLIVQLTPGQEEVLGEFFMEHVCLLEAMLWRARKAVELAHVKSQRFASIMVEMARLSTEYLVNLLSGSYLSSNLWLSLSSGCDNCSISAFSSAKGSALIDTGSTFSKLFRSEFNFMGNWFGEQKSNGVEKFVKEFCELLEVIDVKHTNFFMSTLLTAVLTHHLGWVNTCLPNEDTQTRSPFNPLWGTLTDLYGAVGHPTKMAQTIITGTAQKEHISRILVTLTYFIRSCDTDRFVPTRSDIYGDNKNVDAICRHNSCIPKENYKTYGDHLKEIMSSSGEFLRCSPKKGAVLGRSTGLVKTKTASNLVDLGASACECVHEPEEVGDVVFVLGESDRLVGLKKERPTYLNLSGDFKDCDFVENTGCIKPSVSWVSLTEKEVVPIGNECAAAFSRSQSVPPEEHKSAELKNQSKYRYSGFKFNLQQYPQILSNYMKSKNLEMSYLQFSEKALKFDEHSSLCDTIAHYPEFDASYEEGEALQTPSNASELEFTSDLFVAPPPKPQRAKESSVDAPKPHTFTKQHVPNTIIREAPGDYKTERKVSTAGQRMKIANLPMPKSSIIKPEVDSIRYSCSLMRDSEEYMPDMVLQGPVVPRKGWESQLRSDLALASQHSLIDQPIDEAIAIVANTDSWEVQVMSSHTFIIDKGSSGIRVGMSQLVANMLETFLKMWKLNVPPHFCLMHIEQTLQELCLRSKALAELLIASEFCSMEQLTSALQLEVNDVPLLLAVASTHSPQVTQKYGLSFQ